MGEASLIKPLRRGLAFPMLVSHPVWEVPNELREEGRGGEGDGGSLGAEADAQVAGVEEEKKVGFRAHPLEDA